MAGDWIKIEHVTPNKPEVFRMADSLEIDPDAVVGKLCRIWIWADQQTISGNAPSVTKSLIDRFANVTGFAEAMVSVGWLIETEEGLQFPNFDAHIGQTAKSRALTSRRVAKHKKSKTPESNAVSVTEALPTALPREEKRREENYNHSPASAGESAATCEAQAPQRQPALTEFVFECTGPKAKTWTLPESKFLEYLESYPDLDVRAEIRKARQWIRDNPTRRKTPGGMLSFLTKWLNRSQNEGGADRGGNRGRTGPQIGPGQRYSEGSKLRTF